MHALRKMASPDTQVDSIAPTVVQLSKLSIWKGLRALAFDWIVIAGAISLSVYFDSVSTYLMALILIASRQHALLMLVHEGAHYRLANNHSINNAISDIFAAFPIFFCTTGYRGNHLKHHRYLNSMQDPDWARKVTLPEWTFPQTRFQLWRTMIKILATGWYKMIVLFVNLSGLLSRQTYTSKSALFLLVKKIIFYTALGLAVYKLNLGAAFIAYWIVPFLVVMPVLERIRGISEHFALSYADDFNQTRDILCTRFEAFLFGPHNIRYHLSHHLYPSVPQYNLPRLHEELLKQPEFAASAHQNDAYFWFGKKALWADLIKKGETPHE